MVVFLKYVSVENLDWLLRFHGNIKVVNSKCTQILLQIAVFIIWLVLEILVDKIDWEVPSDQTGQQVACDQHNKDNDLEQALTHVELRLQHFENEVEESEQKPLQSNERWLFCDIDLTHLHRSDLENVVGQDAQLNTVDHVPHVVG